MATNSNSPGSGGLSPPPCATATVAADPCADAKRTQQSPLALVGVSLTIPEREAGKAWRPGTTNCSSPTSDPEKEEASARAQKKKLSAVHGRKKSDGGEDLAVAMPAANLDQLLLADTNAQAAPVHLLMLLQQFGDLSALTSAELLVLLAYIIALEVGYMPNDDDVGSYTRILSTSLYNSENVRRFSSRRLKYTHDALKSCFSIALRSIVDAAETPEQTQLLKSLLTAVVTGDSIIVTLTPDPSSTGQSGHSICLSVPRYVHSSSRSQQRDKPVQQRFQKLGELSHKLRESLFVPLRSQQLLLLGEHRFPALQGLPEELYDDIFGHLSDNQLNCVANVCRCLRDEARRSIARRRSCSDCRS